MSAPMEAQAVAPCVLCDVGDVFAAPGEPVDVVCADCRREAERSASA